MIWTGNVAIPSSLGLPGSLAWTLAEVGDSHRGAKTCLGSKTAPRQTGGALGTIAHHGLAFHAAGRACLLLGLPGEAQ